MEKAIRHYAEQIARQYEDPELRDSYIRTAERLRLPYWDWASFDTMVNGVPNIFLVEQVPVSPPPSGNPQFIPNPLRYYTFTEDIVYTDSAWQRIGAPEYRTYTAGEKTTRHPDPVTKIANDTLLNSNVRFAAQATWIPGVADMFRSTPNYHQFSNHYSIPEAYGTQNISSYGYFPSLEV